MTIPITEPKESRKPSETASRGSAIIMISPAKPRALSTQGLLERQYAPSAKASISTDLILPAAKPVKKTKEVQTARVAALIKKRFSAVLRKTK